MTAKTLLTFRRGGGGVASSKELWGLCHFIEAGYVTCQAVAGQEVGYFIQDSGELTLNKVNSSLNMPAVKSLSVWGT